MKKFIKEELYSEMFELYSRFENNIEINSAIL